MQRFRCWERTYDVFVTKWLHGKTLECLTQHGILSKDIEGEWEIDEAEDLEEHFISATDESVYDYVSIMIRKISTSS